MTEEDEEPFKNSNGWWFCENNISNEVIYQCHLTDH